MRVMLFAAAVVLAPAALAAQTTTTGTQAATGAQAQTMTPPADTATSPGVTPSTTGTGDAGAGVNATTPAGDLSGQTNMNAAASAGGNSMGAMDNSMTNGGPHKAKKKHKRDSTWPR